MMQIADGPPPFTRYSPNSESATRIDRLYVSASLVTSISAMSVVAAPWTDHAAVEMRIGASTRPTASWCFNDAMLRSLYLLLLTDPNSVAALGY